MSGRLFSPTEAQRTALNKLWAKHRRAVIARHNGKKALGDPSELQRELEETIIANERGFDSVQEARR